MKSLARLALTVAAIFAAGELLAACSTSINPVPRGPTGVQSAFYRPTPSSYRVLFNFDGHDGSRPAANLIAVHGVLYGTTSEGGTRGLSPKNGVVFSITTGGKERVLHDFGPLNVDGHYALGGLIEVNGMLYGTTYAGNPSNTGTVYSITTSGKEQVLYSFGEFGPDAMEPSSSLINLNGKLYGTTNFGGASNLGAVFRVTTDGKEKVVHSFGHPYKSDGQIPAARLLDMNGTLYGTTYEGGIYYRGNHCGPAPCPGDGTVFSMSPAGKTHVLHSFGNGSDGLNPQAGLTRVNNTLYGTTLLGGQYGCGIVFSITTTGKERVLHSFDGAAGDGCQPAAALINVGGTLYGTTAYGGTNRAGTVFSVGTTGTERVLHSFGVGSGGKNPNGSLYDLNGMLYGTTENGGTAHHGTIFAMSP